MHSQVVFTGHIRTNHTSSSIPLFQKFPHVSLCRGTLVPHPHVQTATPGLPASEKC
jgi:hypothetical protein